MFSPILSHPEKERTSTSTWASAYTVLGNPPSPELLPYQRNSPPSYTKLGPRLWGRGSGLFLLGPAFPKGEIIGLSIEHQIQIMLRNAHSPANSINVELQMMARHHSHTSAHTALRAASASLIVFQIHLTQISPLAFELEAIRVENTPFHWCKSKLSPFGILTHRCPHQLFSVSQRGPPPANKSGISLTSKACGKDEQPHVGLPHPISLTSPLPSATQTGLQRLDWIQIL